LSRSPALSPRSRPPPRGSPSPPARARSRAVATDTTLKQFERGGAEIADVAVVGVVPPLPALTRPRR
jgi:hypothetical protein